jgi:hypothetical protein
MATPQSTASYKPIPNFPGYRVGDDGSVWSCLRKEHHGPGKVWSVLGTEWKRLKVQLDKKGRPYFGLRRGGKAHTRRVSRIVIEVFVGPRPDGMICCHNDGNPQNNHISNLRWDTYQANCEDAVRYGTAPIGDRHPQRKLHAADIPLIFAAHESGDSQARIGRTFGVSYHTIGKILRRETWKHIPV